MRYRTIKHTGCESTLYNNTTGIVIDFELYHPSTLSSL